MSAFDKWDKVLGYSDPSSLQVIAEVDESEPYETDQTRIATEAGRFALVTASGCSCWEGDWDIEWFETLDALEESARSGGERRYNPSWRALDDLMTQARASLAGSS